MRRTFFLVVLLATAVNVMAELPGFTVAIDNDMLAFSGRDRDYTGGIRFTSSEKLGRTWQGGLVLYTPDDIESDAPVHGDRPYANMLYVARSYSWSGYDAVLYRRTWSVGLLGSRVGESVQRLIHKQIDAPEPEGYDHQISDGGELTGRLGFSRYAHLFDQGTRFGHLTLISESSASVGYITDASYGIGFRLSRFDDHWWGNARNDFLPHVDEPEHADNFSGVFGGVRIRARAYNVFLQGQFRDSEVSVDAGGLRKMIGEAWLGAATAFRGWQVRYVLRLSSAEIKRGKASRSQLWGGLTVRRVI